MLPLFKPPARLRLKCSAAAPPGGFSFELHVSLQAELSTLFPHCYYNPPHLQLFHILPLNLMVLHELSSVRSCVCVCVK